MLGTLVAGVYDPLVATPLTTLFLKPIDSPFIGSLSLAFHPHISHLLTDQNEAGESLKNVILVMHSSNMLVPPPTEGEDKRTEEQKKLWQDSAERIERILPGFLQEVGKA